MLSSTGSGGITACGTVPKAYYAAQNHSSMMHTPVNPNYDSSSFSSMPDVKKRFHMDMVSRLSQEVRTATTTGKIQELRQAVSSGTYTPDPAEIAKRMLFLTEG